MPGHLTARGRRVEITLHAAHPLETGPNTMTVHATGGLDRSEFGIRAPRILIGRHVDVTIDATFQPPT